MSETPTETATVAEKYSHQIEHGFGEVDIADLSSGSIHLLQSRADLSTDTIEDYAAMMSGGAGPKNKKAEFPPVRVFYVAKEDVLYLTAGHHRWHAAEHAGKKRLAAEFFTGTKQEAVVDSIETNATHGLRPSREDIRTSLKMLLDIGKYKKASDRHLSRLIGCSPTTVGNVRKELTDQVDSDDDGTRVDKNGRPMKTANIGKSKKPKSTTTPQQDEPEVPTPDDEQAEEHDDTTTGQEADTGTRRRFRLPNDPTDVELLTVESWLESQDERPAVERFQALWSECGEEDKLAIAQLVKTDVAATESTLETQLAQAKAETAKLHTQLEHFKRHKLTPFEILLCRARQGEDKLTSAYRTLAAKSHPDHGGDAKKFQELQADYEQVLWLTRQREHVCD